MEFECKEEVKFWNNLLLGTLWVKVNWVRGHEREGLGMKRTFWLETQDASLLASVVSSIITKVWISESSITISITHTVA